MSQRQERLAEAWLGLVGVVVGLACMAGMLVDTRPPAQKIADACHHVFGDDAGKCVDDLTQRLAASRRQVAAQRAASEAGL